jgi:hypothetical protein
VLAAAASVSLAFVGMPNPLHRLWAARH